MVGMGTIINSRARLDPMFGSSRERLEAQQDMLLLMRAKEGEGGEAGGDLIGLMACTEEILVALGPTPATLV